MSAPTMEQLYRVNDALTTLARDLGVELTEEFEDEVLNDLTHYVAARLLEVDWK